MSPELQTALPFIIAGLVLLLFVIWLVARSNRKTTILDDETSRPGDVLDDDAARPTRNQALIDAPHAPEVKFGQTTGNANSQEVAAAPMDADAEAGASVAATRTAPGEGSTAGQSQGSPAPSPAAEPAPSPEPAPAPAAPAQSTASPTPSAAPSASAAPADGSGDDLRKIKGLGPKLVALLHENGITRYGQIAAWNDADIDRMDAKLGRFAGRIRRDSWVEQAKLLESGDETAFAQKYGRDG